MTTAPKFLIDLERLNEDVEKVALLMEKYEQDVRISGYVVNGFNFKYQAKLLREAPFRLAEKVQVTASATPVDIHGHTFQGYGSYRFVEVAVDQEYRNFTAIRLLGDSDKPAEQQKRYALYGAYNDIFVPTTINVLANIQTLSDNIAEMFSIPGGSTALRCGADPSILDNVAKNFSDPTLTGGGVNSDLTWTQFLNEYVVPKVTTRTLEGTVLTPEDLEVVSSQYNKNTIKTNAQKVQEELEWSSVAFKQKILETRERGFQINTTSAVILEDPDALTAKIHTLEDAYTQIFDKVSLGCLLKSAAECIIPPMSCKEILRGLRMDNVASKIALAFPNQPRLAAKVDQELAKAQAENEDEFEAADAFLDAIELFIDIEAICDIVNLSLAFTIPTIELPEFDIIDLFGSVEIAIEDAILDALIAAILDMILGIIEDLTNCDNLDALVASAINGEFAQDNALTSDLNLLFSDPAALADPNRGSIAASLDQRWDSFLLEAEPMLENFLTVNADVSAQALNGAVSIGAQLDSVGGIANLKEAIEGNIGEAAAVAVFETFFQGQIDFTQLLRFGDEESAARFESLLAEIGRFELSSDKKEFTLRRISDDQVVTIFSMLSPNPRVDLQVTGKELSQELSSMVDTVASVLSPGEMVQVFAGTATRRVEEIIIELVKVKFPTIDFIARPGIVLTIFEMLGRTTGLGNMRDALILAGSTRRTRQIPRKFCPEDDPALDFKERLLTINQPPEVVRGEIDAIVEKRRIRFNEITDIILRAKENDFSPTDVLEPIICGLNPDGSRPPVVQDALDTTVNMMFEPVKMAFDREIPRYPDAISSEEKAIKIIPRTITGDGSQPALGQGGGGLFGSLADTLGNLGLEPELLEKKVINPEWAMLVSQGMVADGAANAELGPYTDNDVPVVTQDIVRRVGQNFKRGMRLEPKDVSITDVAGSLAINIKGKLPAQSPVSEFVPHPSSQPTWEIKYEESGDTGKVTIEADGQFSSQRFGRIPFSDNFSFEQQRDTEIAREVIDHAAEFDLANVQKASKQSVYSGLLSSKLKSAASTTAGYEALEGEIVSHYDAKYDEFVASFMGDAGRRLTENRLLQKIPNTSTAQMLPGGTQKEEAETLLINLINFAPDPTDEQKRCGSDPHILDLEFIKKLVKDEYDKSCENESENNGTSRSKSPINSSGFVGAVLTIVRLYAIEYVLRGLFLFDEYGYREDFADEPLIVDYITFRMKRDLERQGDLTDETSYYKTFEREARRTYRKMVAAEQFEEEELTAANHGIPTELKVLVREQLREVLTKMRALVGESAEEGTGKNPNKDLLQSLPEIDTYSENNNRRFTNLFGEQESDRIPFPPTIPAPTLDENGNVVEAETPLEPGKFIVERYVRVPLSTNDGLRPQQQASNIVGVVNFEDFEKFVEENAAAFGDRNIDDLFGEPLHFGCRLVNVAPLTGEAVEKVALASHGKKFVLEDSKKLSLNESIVSHERSFYVLEERVQAVAAAGLELTEGALSPFEDALASVGVNLGNPPGPELPDSIFEYTEYSSVPVASSETAMSSFDKFEELGSGLLASFNEKYRSSLFDALAEEEDIRLLFEYCFAPKKLASLLYLHSTMTLNSEDMLFLFEGTKSELKKLFENLLSMGNYLDKSEGQVLNGTPGNAAHFKKDFDDIGAPGGPKGPDAFFYHTITPIMILRGLAELVDPNISITAKIVAAGNAGYLLPKFVDNQLGLVEGPPGEFSLPPIEYTKVRVLITEAEASASVSEKWDPDAGQPGARPPRSLIAGETIDVAAHQNIPSWLSTSTKVEVAPALAAGDIPAFVTKLRGGDSGTPEIDNVNGEEKKSIYGKREGRIQKSEPVFPGTPIDLSYNLVSWSMLPLNKMFPFLGPFCGPPTTPVGEWFLALEPFLYQLPNFKITKAKGDVAEEVKKVHKLDLKAPEKFMCEDNTEPEE